MTTALLTLGPLSQPNGKLRVTIISKWPSPPEDFFMVTAVDGGKLYRAHQSQLSDYQKVEES